MDDYHGRNGKSGQNSNGTGEVSYILLKRARLFIILGWICAALTALFSPLFAIGGIVFGALVNRLDHGRGNAIIITNTVIAAINIVFGLFMLAALRRMMFVF